MNRLMFQGTVQKYKTENSQVTGIDERTENLAAEDIA